MWSVTLSTGNHGVSVPNLLLRPAFWLSSLCRGRTSRPTFCARDESQSLTYQNRLGGALRKGGLPFCRGCGDSRTARKSCDAPAFWTFEQGRIPGRCNRVAIAHETGIRGCRIASFNPPYAEFRMSLLSPYIQSNQNGAQNNGPKE